LSSDDSTLQQPHKAALKTAQSTAILPALKFAFEATKFPAYSAANEQPDVLRRDSAAYDLPNELRAHWPAIGAAFRRTHRSAIRAAFVVAIFATSGCAHVFALISAFHGAQSAACGRPHSSTECSTLGVAVNTALVTTFVRTKWTAHNCALGTTVAAAHVTTICSAFRHSQQRALSAAVQPTQ
jgi:hypothetical protein